MEAIPIIIYGIVFMCVVDSLLFDEEYSFLKKMVILMFFIIGTAIVWKYVDKSYRCVTYPRQHIYTFATIDNDTYENGTNCSRCTMTCKLNNQVYKVKEFKETGFH